MSTVCSAQLIPARNEGISGNGLTGLECADDRQREDNFVFSVSQNAENQVGFDAPPSMMMTTIEFAKTSSVVLMTASPVDFWMRVVRY